MNLFLALFWFLFAVILLAWEWTTGDSRLYIRGTNISFAWVLFALAGYNLVRWWGMRALRQEQRAVRAARERRPRHGDRHEPPPAEPDPNFDFTSEPPSGPHITDRPPNSSGSRGVE